MAIDNSSDVSDDSFASPASDRAGGATDHGSGAIDDGGDATDQGGDTPGQSNDGADGETGSGVVELDRDTEHDNAAKALESVQRDLAGRSDRPDPGGEPNPDTPDDVDDPDEKKKDAEIPMVVSDHPAVQTADLHGQFQEIDKQHADIAAAKADMEQATTANQATYQEQPDKPTEPPATDQVTFIGTAAILAGAAGKAIGDRISAWRSKEDDGDPPAADDPDDDERPRS